MYPPAQRTLDILELLADAPDGLALSVIGARLRIPKSATHRLLAGLAAHGFVRQVAATTHYTLTLKLAALGFRQLAGTRIEEVCQPVLDRLATRSGELARLAVVEGDSMTWVAKAQGALSGLRYDADAGRDVLLHATAVGKVWLASLPEARALAIVAHAGFDTGGNRGPRAVHSLTAMRQHLRETRKRGYGEAVDEGEPGVAALAAAVHASRAIDSPVVATVSVAGPLARLTATRRAALIHDVLAAAAEVTDCWPVREHHRRSAPAIASSTTVELAHAV
jgi:IclR family acetate operon transcriptional repressor